MKENLIKNTSPRRGIAVIGAGIAGLSAALVLNRNGHNIHLFDKNGFPNTASASAIAGGMLAPNCEADFIPPAYHNAAKYALSFWRDILGDDLCRADGSIIIAHPADKHMMARFVMHLPDDAQISHLKHRSEIEEIEAGLSHFAEAYHIAGEGHLNPQRAITHIIDILQQSGTAQMVPRPWNDEQAETFDYILDCRGMDGADNPAAGHAPLRAVKGEVITVKNPAFALNRPVRIMHPRYPLYVIPRGDGIFTIGASIIESGENTNPNIRSTMEMLSALNILHPSFADAQILDIKAGLRPAYSDNLPRIKRAGKTISINGLFRHGWLLAPALAETCAALIDGQEHEYMSLFIKEDQNEHHHQRRA